VPNPSNPAGLSGPLSGQEALALLTRLRAEVARFIVGQDLVVNRLLVGLLAGGHVLIEGVPGLAKSLVVKLLGDVCGLTFKRIQFTPDLLPSDVTGTLVFNPNSGGFSVHKGPVFAHLVLADEVNRAPAKVQSALLEAMQEQQVTIGQTTYPIDDPFMVVATQNPLEHEGTYALPEAQLDRFMLHIASRYPDERQEIQVVDRHLEPSTAPVTPVLTPELVIQARRAVASLHVDPLIRAYVVSIVRATRTSARSDSRAIPIRLGASPRAGVHLALAARAHAFIEGRGHVLPEDVRSVCLDVLRHRVLLTYDAEADGLSVESAVQHIVDAVPIP
jgi:MoxR-like ATPase